MTKYEEVLKRIHKEQELYLAKVEQLPPKEIIYKAYEICYREEIINILENTEFTDGLYEHLLQTSSIIAYLYDKWLGMDCGVYEMLEDMINQIEVAR